MDYAGQMTNLEWQAKLSEVNYTGAESAPRGMKVREVLNGHYTVPMPAFISLAARDVNYSFMFAEAVWILSGSNRLGDITPYMKFYKNFSDDGIFLRGAYGPKVVDQLPYVVQSIVDDNDTRQAVLTTWRERPGHSKDVPCTVSMQFLLRDGKLHSVVTMRSNDIVLGYTYDVFTFSMVAQAVRLLLNERDVSCELGTLHVNAGSLHLYERHFEDATKWTQETDVNSKIFAHIDDIMKLDTYEALMTGLIDKAKELRNA